jgi:hypothetical protein
VTDLLKLFLTNKNDKRGMQGTKKISFLNSSAKFSYEYGIEKETNRRRKRKNL